eukprot:scaffold307174_cov24-Tisochrysis_lutea.AAC.1
MVQTARAVAHSDSGWRKRQTGPFKCGAARDFLVRMEAAANGAFFVDPRPPPGCRGREYCGRPP